MKKKLIFVLCLSSLMMVGCDTNEEKDIGISSTTRYVNTTESVDVNTYNGFRLVGNELIENEDGSYRVILDFDLLFK